MPKAKSLSGKTEVVRRWKIYTDGRVEDPHGHIHSELPVEIGFSPQCVDLAIRGSISLEGVSARPKDMPKTPALVEPVLQVEPASELTNGETWAVKKKNKK
jgi:hypothetical protein